MSGPSTDSVCLYLIFPQRCIYQQLTMFSLTLLQCFVSMTLLMDSRFISLHQWQPSADYPQVNILWRPWSCDVMGCLNHVFLRSVAFTVPSDLNPSSFNDVSTHCVPTIKAFKIDPLQKSCCKFMAIGWEFTRGLMELTQRQWLERHYKSLIKITKENTWHPD